MDGSASDPIGCAGSRFSRASWTCERGMESVGTNTVMMDERLSSVRQEMMRELSRRTRSCSSSTLLLTPSMPETSRHSNRPSTLPERSPRRREKACELRLNGWRRSVRRAWPTRANITRRAELPSLAIGSSSAQSAATRFHQTPFAVAAAATCSSRKSQNGAHESRTTFLDLPLPGLDGRDELDNKARARAHQVSGQRLERSRPTRRSRSCHLPQAPLAGSGARSRASRSPSEVHSGTVAVGPSRAPYRGRSSKRSLIATPGVPAAAS